MDDMTSAACCAECGEGGADLKMCNACKYAKYCSVTCQRQHWPSHKEECKQLAARLHDESLFKQPPPKEDCPICLLPMPFAYEAVATCYPCCGKVVCYGCICSSWYLYGNSKCVFCNASLCDENLVEIDCDVKIARLKKRVEANDANAIYYLGLYYALGLDPLGCCGLQQDYNKAIELWTRAAGLGSSTAHSGLGQAYFEGLGVEKDAKKATHHYELAAMAGHEVARYKLGFIEYEAGNIERAIKHWMISASAGHSMSMKGIKRGFDQGEVNSDVYELTLKEYNDSCDAMRSKSREDVPADFY